MYIYIFFFVLFVKLFPFLTDNIALSVSGQFRNCRIHPLSLPSPSARAPTRTHTAAAATALQSNSQFSARFISGMIAGRSRRKIGRYTYKPPLLRPPVRPCGSSEPASPCPPDNIVRPVFFLNQTYPVACTHDRPTAATATAANPQSRYTRTRRIPSILFRRTFPVGRTHVYKITYTFSI